MTTCNNIKKTIEKAQKQHREEQLDLIAEAFPKTAAAENASKIFTILTDVGVEPPSEAIVNAETGAVSFCGMTFTMKDSKVCGFVAKPVIERRRRLFGVEERIIDYVLPDVEGGDCYLLTIPGRYIYNAWHDALCHSAHAPELYQYRFGHPYPINALHDIIFPVEKEEAQ